MKRIPNDFIYLEEMYTDSYFPDFLVDKLKDLMLEIVNYLETGEKDLIKIQSKLDEVIEKTNELQEEFDENGSEIETVARDSIGTTVDDILEYFGIDVDIETAIGARDW